MKIQFILFRVCKNDPQFYIGTQIRIYITKILRHDFNFQVQMADRENRR